jgi:short-subunit dehydrogenase
VGDHRCASAPASVASSVVDDLRGANALLTGAAGGLGRHIASALARRGVNLAVSGRRSAPLEELCHELRRAGVSAEPLAADLAELDEAAALVERAEELVGPLDLLINNAGVEDAAAYAVYGDDELEALVRVNLLAPMVLTRHVLPGMLERGAGHVVTVSSLAGKGGSAFNAPYATTKAALVGLTRSLRAELAGGPVGASVVCPGFVARDGMYPRMQELGLEAPLLLRAVEPERVSRAVIDAIRGNRAEILVTGWPFRPLLALQELAPELAERIVLATGARDFFERLAERRGRTDRRRPLLRSCRDATADRKAARAAP